MEIAVPTKAFIQLEELAGHPAFRFDSPGGTRFKRETAALLEMVEQKALIQPRTASNIYRILQQHTGELELEDGFRLATDTVQKFEGASHLRVVVNTIGGGIANEVLSLQNQGHHLAAVLLDAIGNFAILKFSSQVTEKNEREARAKGLKTTRRHNPGDGVIGLAQQGVLLELAGAAAIGVSVATGSMMNPRYSLSAVFGLGKGVSDLHPSQECDDCKSKSRCPHARVSTPSQTSNLSGGGQ